MSQGGAATAPGTYLRSGRYHGESRSESPQIYSELAHQLLYELSWLQVSRRQYSDAAETFVKLNDLNKWSPAIYHCLAGGDHNNSHAHAMYLTTN